MDLSAVQTILQKVAAYHQKPIDQKKLGEDPHGLEGRDKDYIGDHIIKGQFTSKQFSEVSGIPRRTVDDYKVKAQGSGNRDKKGQPRIVDPVSIEELRREAIVHRVKRNCLTPKELIEKILEESRETGRRAVSGGGSPRESISRSSYYNIKQQMGAKVVKGQSMSQARADAISDIRNAFTLACAYEAFVKVLNPALVMNMDDFQVNVEHAGSQCRLVIVKDPGGASELIPPTKISNGRVGGQAVKVRWLINAAGNQGDGLMIIGDDNICPNKDDFLVFKVPGLGTSSDPRSFAYVAFCHTRGMCDPLFKWYHQTVVSDFVSACRQAYGIAEDEYAVLTKDGEMKEMKMLVNDPAMAEFMATNGIFGLKLPASTSHVFQALDNSDVIISCKQTAKGQTEAIIDTFTSNIERSLRNALEPISGKMKKQRFDEVIWALCNVHLAAQRSFRHDRIIRAFQQCGLFNPSMTVEPSWTMDKCATTMTALEKNHLMSKVNDGVAIILDQGYISEAQLDQLGVMKNVPHRSELVVKSKNPSNQRAVVWSHPRFLDSFRVANRTEREAFNKEEARKASEAKKEEARKAREVKKEEKARVRAAKKRDKDATKPKKDVRKMKKVAAPKPRHGLAKLSAVSKLTKEQQAIQNNKMRVRKSRG